MKENFQEKLRFPAVAGQFYPEDEKELARMIEKILKETKVPEIEGKIFGFLVPHAGYLFSGSVAGYSFKMIEGKDFESVILIGDSHWERFEGVSIWERGEWETPLGRVKMDKELAKDVLKESKRFFVRDSVHLFEYSLEVLTKGFEKIQNSSYHFWF